MAAPLLLVVDDMPELGLIVERLGRRAGHEVVCRLDVASAWAYLESAARPDLVLVDINLSGESGVVLCRRIQAVPALAGLRVAVFSHWGRSADIAAGLEAGAEYVVAKDLVCRPADWQARLAEILHAPNSRSGGFPLVCTGTVGVLPPSQEWIEGMHRALQHPTMQQLGPEVGVVLLRRALARAAGDGAGHGDLAALARRHDPELVLRAAVALAEQMWCLVGTAGSEPFRAALTAAIPPLKEILPH